MSNIKKILFFSEAVTLAHVARPMILAQALAYEGYEVHFAWNKSYQELFPSNRLVLHSIRSISSKLFLSKLADGDPVYDMDTLINYAEEDLELIKIIKPDIIVGDFRLSLAISAELSKIIYISITNAYWSPYSKMNCPIADHPLVEFFGVKCAQRIFNLVRPFVFAYHCLPLNKARKYFGLTSLGYDLKLIYSYADYTLYSDVPGLFPKLELPSNHRFIGPVVWSPNIKLPAWWVHLPKDKPIVYCNLGSSGAIQRLTAIIQVLSELPLTIIASSAGRKELIFHKKNVFVDNFLNGNEVCAIADLVICNGGSPSTQQALIQGVPVLGVASNMDQHLNMETIVNAGAGELLRAGNLELGQLRDITIKIINNPDYKSEAVKISKLYQKFNPEILVVDFIKSIS